MRATTTHARTGIRAHLAGPRRWRARPAARPDAPRCVGARGAAPGARMHDGRAHRARRCPDQTRLAGPMRDQAAFTTNTCESTRASPASSDIVRPGSRRRQQTQPLAYLGRRARRTPLASTGRSWRVGDGARQWHCDQAWRRRGSSFHGRLRKLDGMHVSA